MILITGQCLSFTVITARSVRRHDRPETSPVLNPFRIRPWGHEGTDHTELVRPYRSSNEHHMQPREQTSTERPLLTETVSARSQRGSNQDTLPTDGPQTEGGASPEISVSDMRATSSSCRNQAARHTCATNLSEAQQSEGQTHQQELNLMFVLNIRSNMKHKIIFYFKMKQRCSVKVLQSSIMYLKCQSTCRADSYNIPDAETWSEVTAGKCSGVKSTSNMYFSTSSQTIFLHSEQNLLPLITTNERAVAIFNFQHVSTNTDLQATFTVALHPHVSRKQTKQQQVMGVNVQSTAL